VRLTARRSLTAFLILAAAEASTLEAQPIKPGKRAPEIDLPTLNGGRFELSKLRGRAVVVSFWGTWCPPCRDEFPELIKAQAKYAERGLLVLAVNGRDQERSTRDVQQFVDLFPVSFVVALDKYGSTRRAYRIVGQPTTVFIDASGIVRQVHTGLISHEELEEGIALILPVPR
jgi:thiol-disulfide isomerase/thioredoxin